MTRLSEIYNILYKEYGAQGWWPVSVDGRPQYHVRGRTLAQRFEVCIGAILTQNTAWKNAERAIINLNAHHLLGIKALAAIKKGRLAALIRPSGYFNQKAERLILFAKYVHKNGIRNLMKTDTAKLRDELLSLKGIGPETADSMLLYAFEKPVFVVDAYTKRIFSRMGLCSENAGYDELQKIFHSSLKRDTALFNEYHALIVEHAKRHCRKKPECMGCAIRRMCQRKV